jgi:hypothetical protein
MNWASPPAFQGAAPCLLVRKTHFERAEEKTPKPPLLAGRAPERIVLEQVLKK